MTGHDGHAHYDGRCLDRPPVTLATVCLRVAQPRSCSCQYETRLGELVRTFPDPDCAWHRRAWIGAG